MEVLERSDAKAIGVSQYFTGKPCKSGHITYRYTSSGACFGCVTSGRNAVPAMTPEAVRELRQAPIEAAAHKCASVADQIIELKFRAFHADASTLAQTAEAMCVARYPDVPVIMFRSSGASIRVESSTAMYKIKLHKDDLDMVQAVANALFGARVNGNVDMAAARQHAVGQAVKIAPPVPTDGFDYDKDPT